MSEALHISIARRKWQKMLWINVEFILSLARNPSDRGLTPCAGDSALRLALCLPHEIRGIFHWGTLRYVLCLGPFAFYAMYFAPSN